MPVLCSVRDHVEAEAEQFVRPGVAGAETLQRAEHRADRPLLFVAQCAARVPPGHAAQAARLLGEVFEKVPVLLDALDLEPAGRKMVAVPVAAEARGEM